MLATAFDFLKTRRRGRDISPGAIYESSNGPAGVERVEVLSVSRDETGIAHVRFHVQIAQGDMTFVDEERILALDSFRDRFCGRATA